MKNNLLQTGPNRIRKTTSNNCKCSREGAINSPSPVALLRENCLSEFRTEVEKAEARKNLGIADSQTLKWGNIGGYLELQKDVYNAIQDSKKSENNHYETEENPDIVNVRLALDKLIYVAPEIVSFTIDLPLVYETGTVVKQEDVKWNYNKYLIKEQKFEGESLDLTIRLLHLEREIDSNTTLTLWCTDGTNTSEAILSISFVDYIYYGTFNGEEETNRGKVNPENPEFTVTSIGDEHMWIFIPASSGYTKIWHNYIDSTDAFDVSEILFLTDTEVTVNGKLYVAKHSGLNETIIKLT